MRYDLIYSYKLNKRILNYFLFQGWYACAGLNEAGSTVKRIFIRVINSTGGRDNENVPMLFDTIGSNDRFSNEQNILINSVLATSPNALDITWETNDGIPATTLTLHYRTVGGNEFQTATAMIDAKEYTINDLKAHTEYEVFASVPHGLSGSISNIRKGIPKKCLPFEIKTTNFVVLYLLNEINSVPC